MKKNTKNVSLSSLYQHENFIKITVKKNKINHALNKY